MQNKTKLKIKLQKFMINIFVCILFLLFKLTIIGFPLLLNYFEILNFSAVYELYDVISHRLWRYPGPNKMMPSVFFQAIFTQWFCFCWSHILHRILYMLIYKLTGYNHSFMLPTMTGATAQAYVFVYTKGPDETWGYYLAFRIFIFICFLLGRFVMLIGAIMLILTMFYNRK